MYPNVFIYVVSTNSLPPYKIYSALILLSLEKGT